jgi:hypothetical protein
MALAAARLLQQTDDTHSFVMRVLNETTGIFSFASSAAELSDKIESPLTMASTR